MEDLKGRFQVVTGLAHDAANDWGDGPGDHARSGASFLTGCHAWKTKGAKLQLGISVDQVAARQVGHLTRIDSLQLGTEAGRLYGSCDTGYACAYQYNLSWASETLPLPPEPNPRAVFERLFGGGGQGRGGRRQGPDRAAQERPRLRPGGRQGPDPRPRPDRPAEGRGVPGRGPPDRGADPEVRAVPRPRPGQASAARPASRTTTRSTWP